MLLKETAGEKEKKTIAMIRSLWRVFLLSLTLSLVTLFNVSQLFAADNNIGNQTVDKSAQTENLSASSIQKRFEKIENTLESIKVTGEKAEDRSYFNKLASYEVIKYLKMMVLLLILIALGFPLAIWLLNRSS
ncbi:MAG: hypothetical protein ACP5VS_00135, partial [Desulfomonilaceae bacterium]